MRRDPRLHDAAAGRVPCIAGIQSPPGQILAELERRCAGLRVRSGGERVDTLFLSLDRFASLASDLTDGLAQPAGIDPSMRRAFDAAYETLDEAFEGADDVLAPLADLTLTNAQFDAALDAAADLLATLEPIRVDAARLYQRLAVDVRALLYPGVRDAIEVRLIDAGFADPLTAARRLRTWQDGTVTATRSLSEQGALPPLLPDLIAEFGKYDDPDATLAAFDEIVCRLPADTALFGPLRARPSLMRSLLGLIGHAPSLSRNLIARPALIAGLIDSSAYAPLPAAPDLDAEFKLLLSGGDRSAGALRVAQAASALRFGIGLQLLEGSIDPLEAALANSDLAEAALRTITDDVLARMAEVHGRVASAELVILALGRFGGQALSQQSNLDIVYLFTGDDRAQSDSRSRSLDANEYFGRAAQQITTAMSTVTPLGPLYEIDTRMRPWGAQGMLACSTDAFHRYHYENGWTWEHMALTRARPVYGSDAASALVKCIINQRLRAPRDRAALLLDAMKMRKDVTTHAPPSGPFDVQLMPGGLVDLEFAVHVRQLDHHVGIHPRMRTAIRSLASAGLISPDVVRAQDLLSRMSIILSLLAPHGQEPAPGLRARIAEACGQPHWDALIAAYEDAREIIHAAWRSTVAQRPIGGD